MSGAASPCLRASLINCAASQRAESPSNATKLAVANPPRAENIRSGSSGGSPSASACSISRRACSAADLVSGAAYPLI